MPQMSALRAHLKPLTPDAAPVFSQGARPAAGGGEAAFWLPLLGLFTGARLGELAPLTAADVTTDQATGIPIITITEDRENGRRLKTAASARVVPVHPELVRLGLLRFVEEAKRGIGSEARLFPALTPGAGSDDCGHPFRLKADSDSDRLRTAFR
jgi:integrase